MSDAYGSGDYSLVPVDHDPFSDVGASMARHLTGNPAAGPGPNPAQAVLDWRNSGQSWADQYHDYAQRAVQGPQAAIEAAGNPMDLFGGFVGSTAPEGAGLKGITALHASPYDFDRFDISKIGTGQGAQSFGHGLYMAENPAVSGPMGQYDLEMTAKNLGKYDLNQQESSILRSLREGKSDLDILLDQGRMGSTFDEATAALQRVKDAKARLYQVSIAADPEHFLDWDKPLSEQSPKVQEAMSAFVDKAKQEAVDRAISSYSKARQDQLWNEVKDPTGQLMYQAAHRNAAGAAEALRNAGVPGIKYFDQGSRGAGQGTSNYVVFDDNLISIIKKYGIAGLIAGGASHFSTTPVDHNPYASGMAHGGRVGRKARVAAILQRHGIAA